MAATGAALAAANAHADVGVTFLTRSARVGTIVRARAPARMPLYLVPAARAPRPHRCGPNALCEQRVPTRPRHAPYTPLHVLDRTPAGVIRVRVPRVRPGRYRAVLYCDACYRGPGGSLVASDNTLRVR
jgi:hypothetical protein